MLILVDSCPGWLSPCHPDFFAFALKAAFLTTYGRLPGNVDALGSTVPATVVDPIHQAAHGKCQFLVAILSAGCYNCTEACSSSDWALFQEEHFKSCLLPNFSRIGIMMLSTENKGEKQ